MCIACNAPTNNQTGVTTPATNPGAETGGADFESLFQYNRMWQPFASIHPIEEMNDTAPIGKNKREAQQLAWMMSVAPKADDSDIRAFVERVNIQRILTAEHEGKRMYDRLLCQGESDVNMSDYERDYAFRWDLCPDDTGHNDDPFFLRQIASEVQRSISTFIVTLDLTCMSLAGMRPGQNSNGVLQQMMKVRNYATYELSRLVMQRNATHQDVVNKTREIEERYSSDSVKAHKQEMQRSLTGISALSNIAAAVSNESEFVESLQIHYAEARDVCAWPPHHFEDALASQNIPINVLRACFVHNPMSALGASNLPPSSSRIADMVREFFGNEQLSARFRIACVSAINTLRLELGHTASSDIWSNVEVVECDDMQTISVSCINTVYPLRPPTHCSSNPNVALVMKQGSPSGIRVVRFLKSLVMAAESGMFVPRKVKASILLATVARFRSEKRFRVSAIEEQVIFPLSEECGLTFPAEEAAGSVIVENIPTGSTAQNRPCDLAPLVPSSGIENREACVPLQLERDYHIIVAFKRLLASSGGKIPLKQIGGMLRTKGAYFEGYTERSVEQSVAHVVDKCVKGAVKTMLAEGELQYVRAESGVKGGGHVVTNSPGAAVLSDYLRTTLSSMETADATFMKDWHVSRSSRNKAKSLAASKAVEKPKHATKAGQKRSKM